jgi:HAD superfamily hydrolase (TIGR01509 family)
MKWKAIIFDRDGTLFDSLPVILRSFNYAVEPFRDQPVSDQEWVAAFGPAEPEVIGNFIPADKKQEAFQRFLHYYQEHFHEIGLFAGIREILHQAHDSGVKLGLFTGGGLTSTKFCLGKENILYLFDVLVTGDQVRHPKPHPEGVLKALATLEVAASDALLVGDAAADVAAGKGAGVTTVLARWGGAPPYDAPSRPDFVFDSVSEFCAFLR